MWLAALLLTCVAWATPQEDLALAANPELPEVARLQAFDRLVQAGGTDIALVTRTASQEDADTRARWVSIRVLGKVRGDRARTLLVGVVGVLHVLALHPLPFTRLGADETRSRWRPGTRRPRRCRCDMRHARGHARHSAR